jgi:hypothetical protein
MAAVLEATLKSRLPGRSVERTLGRFRCLGFGGLKHEDLGGHVRVKVDLGHEGDDLAAGRLLHGVREWLAHRHLELLTGALDRFVAAGVDQRPFPRGVDVFEVDGEEVALVDDAGGARSSSVVVAVEACDCGSRGSRLPSVLALLKHGHSDSLLPLPELGARREEGSGGAAQRTFAFTIVAPFENPVVWHKVAAVASDRFVRGSWS